MTAEERIIALERELVQTRTAAVSIATGMADAIIKSSDGREELAEGFEVAAEDADEVTAQLARAVAAKLRNG